MSVDPIRIQKKPAILANQALKKLWKRKRERRQARDFALP
jgi:hypothetical protein